MSEESEQALEMISSGRLDEASRIADRAVQLAPDDWHTHYVAGQCFRWSQDFPKACAALSRANELWPRQPSILLALGIARQLNAEYAEAVAALRLALEIDPSDVLAYNSLALTQRLMGDYEKAAATYEKGAKALAHEIIKSLRNGEDSPRLPHWDSRANLWLEYAMGAAIYMAASQAGIESVSWLTGEGAVRDTRTEKFRGWYWQDQPDQAGKLSRLLLPNYFNTFCARLRRDKRYAMLIDNRGGALRLMGEIEEADQHVQEFEDFTPPAHR